MTYEIVIKNGTVVTSSDTFMADVAIIGERIAALGQDLDGKLEIDAAGKFVTPGAVDIHVHLQMPIGKFVSSDDFYSGTRAAAFGGTTSIVDFIEPKLEESMMAALEARRKLADPAVVIDYGLHMTIGPAELDKLDQLDEVFEAGCASFKLYMAYALHLDDGQLFQALEKIAAVGGLAVVHAENWDIICLLVNRNLARGRVEARWHPRSRPAEMEGEAAGRVIEIAAMVGTPLHIFHVSCQNVVEKIAEARRRGLPVTGETCPQYLLLTQEVYDRPSLAGALPVCSPPIRYQESQDALWSALKYEALQVVSTDHCPFSSAEKATGLGDFSAIPGGVPSIEMRFPALYSYGVQQGHLSLNQWVSACCTNPARIAGFERKGEVQVGFDADLVIFDPFARVTLSPKFLHEKVDWTLYEGLELVGWPEATISRGRIIVQDGKFLGAAGQGSFVARKYSGPPLP